MSLRHARSARLAAAVSGVLATVAGLATAHAQSTASQELDEIVVTASRQNDMNGLLVLETAPRARASITQEFIATQAAGQTIIQTLNLTPGLNFTNNDPFGSSGGNIRLRGFDGNRVSLTFDGIPLNDTGNYAVFTNQQLDPELIERANVNLGTTDVDSPTASATGGTINYVTRKPADEAGGLASLSLGSFNYRRAFLLGDTGTFGPWGTKAFASVSYQNYDKFRGEGELEKQQYNARLYQAIGDDGDFVSLAFHWNRNRNNNYRTITQPVIASERAAGRDWREYDFDLVCNRPSFPGRPGVADLDDAATSATPGLPSPASCTNFWGRQINPSNTGNIRGQSRFTFGNGFAFTFDPSLQYVRANGGGQTTVLAENDRSVIGTAAVAGRDLNGDGDLLDRVRLFWPSLTNTYRVGLTSSLIWDFTDDQRVRVSYTYDRGRHRQTGKAGPLTPDAKPESVWGGMFGRPVLAADGFELRSRDRRSVAELNQVSFEYRGQFLEDALTLNAGVRAPKFKRELNQFCFSQNGSSAVRCTTEAVTATLPNGNVTLAGGGTTQFIPPYAREVEFDDVLPNVGVSYRLFERHSVFASYAEGFSAPRTDNLYTVTRLPNGGFTTPLVEPETTRTYDLGYRFDGDAVLASVTVWRTDFTNRIVTSFDETLGQNVDRNVGSVQGQGVDGQVAWRVLDTLRLYASASYNDSTVEDNIRTSATFLLPTDGRQLAETPEWTYGGRAEWDALPSLVIGTQAKYVSKRFSTDVNDEYAGAYAVVDVDASYSFADLGFENLSLQLNVTNVLDRAYLGSISSQFNAQTVSSAPGGVGTRTGTAPTYQIGAPRTYQVQFRARF